MLCEALLLGNVRAFYEPKEAEIGAIDRGIT